MIPDLSVFWVIFFVLLAVAVLDRLLMTPLRRVMRERQTAVQSARELAENAASRATAAAQEFETRTQAARAEIYRQMDEQRRIALERRGELLAATRGEADRALDDARARLRADVEQARARLQQDAQLLSTAITERILERQPSEA